jgi:short subunit dehydrogenase-like uncharacterized protein
MAARIVVFGATGYTGELVARALLARDVQPVLAARCRDRLDRLVAALGGGLETRLADVERPETVRALVEPSDVLISTVGPFVRWGDAAVEAAVGAGAHYLDTTGEPAFIRRVFERYGPRARAAGCALVTAFGYDWVPGNLAAALALRDAGPEATRVDIGYFSRGGGSISGGTRASTLGAALEPSFAHRGGRLRTERTGARVRSFEVTPGEPRWALSVGGSEHLALPALHPTLRDVDVFMAAAGASTTRLLPALTLAAAAANRVRPVRTRLQDFVRNHSPGSTGGPDTEARARTSSVVIGEAYSSSNALLSSVRLQGVNGYTFTGAIVAWGAITAAAGLASTGALGPVTAFGLAELECGVHEAGISRV